jgi:hypothetical protein
VNQEVFVDPAASGAWIVNRRNAQGSLEYVGRYATQEEAEDVAAALKGGDA